MAAADGGKATCCAGVSDGRGRAGGGGLIGAGGHCADSDGRGSLVPQNIVGRAGVASAKSRSEVVVHMYSLTPD